jgi:CBS domain-containing protein
MTPRQEVPVLHPGDRLPEVVEKLSKNPHALPVVDVEGRMLGVVTLQELVLASRSPDLHHLIVATDLMRGGVTPLKPDDRLDRAMELFVENDLLALPVVDGTPEGRIVGMVKRVDVSSTYLRRVHGAPTVGINISESDSTG